MISSNREVKRDIAIVPMRLEVIKTCIGPLSRLRASEPFVRTHLSILNYEIITQVKKLCPEERCPYVVVWCAVVGCRKTIS